MLTICLISFLLQNHLKTFFFYIFVWRWRNSHKHKSIFQNSMDFIYFFFIITFLTYGMNFPRDHYSYLINV